MYITIPLKYTYEEIYAGIFYQLAIFESEFGNALKTSIEPTLQGSLKVTIYNCFIDLYNIIDLQTVTDWS